MISHSGRKRVAASKATPTTTPKRLSAQARDLNSRTLITTTQRAFGATSGSRLFETDAGDLWELYLKNFTDERERQFYNCHCCRRFIQRFGHLVTIDENGHTTPAMWTLDLPAIADAHRASFSAMFHRVKAARVTGVFLCKDEVWGDPMTLGGWEHLAVGAMMVGHTYRERALTAGQAMAAKKQDFITVSTALGEFTAPVLDQALRLLDADALARSEKFIGPVKWLRQLHDRPKGRAGVNVLWRAIAAAPNGYFHVKSSVIGPLLEDIRIGKPVNEIMRSFEAMMHPLRYQRPQAAPAAQNIEAAEKLIEKLGYAKSLERRFARLYEVQTHWTPGRTATEKAVGVVRPGVFSHLNPKDGSGAVMAVDLPEKTMTADKFVSTVVPFAERMEFLVPQQGDFSAMLTAEHRDAPIIFKWGNAFSWYVYSGGSSARRWGLSPIWTKVTALVRRPTMWNHDKPMDQWGDGYLLVLEGAVDSREDSGNALFPEMLVAELHGVRSTIEAYSKTAKIGGREDASVCGHCMGPGDKNLRVRVFANGGWAPYLIDRWS